MSKIDERKIKAKKQLQVKILRRFMSEGEVRKLTQTYRAHFRGGAIDREENLNLPLRRDERLALRGYVFELDKSVRQISEEFKLTSVGQLGGRAGRAALKIVFQNQDKLNLKKLLGGGE